MVVPYKGFRYQYLTDSVNIVFPEFYACYFLYSMHCIFFILCIVFSLFYALYFPQCALYFLQAMHCINSMHCISSPLRLTSVLPSTIWSGICILSMNHTPQPWWPMLSPASTAEGWTWPWLLYTIWRSPEVHMTNHFKGAILMSCIHNTYCISRRSENNPLSSMNLGVVIS